MYLPGVVIAYFRKVRSNCESFTDFFLRGGGGGAGGSRECFRPLPLEIGFPYVIWGLLKFLTMCFAPS